MNKKTRTFIWGLILFGVCSLGLAIHLSNMLDHKFEGGYHWVLFAGTLWGSIIGAKKISGTTY
jgi:hypothetical protein